MTYIENILLLARSTRSGMLIESGHYRVLEIQVTGKNRECHHKKQMNQGSDKIVGAHLCVRPG